MTTWSTDETFQFIELYRQEACIWNTKSKDHKDKTKVNDSWTRISDAMGISVPELKRKKESLMTAFRNHIRRKNMSIRSGGGEGEIYKPTWIFYDVMEAFLKDMYEGKITFNTEEEVTLNGEFKREAEDEEIGAYGSSQNEGSETSQNEHSGPSQKSGSAAQKRHSKDPSEFHEVYDIMNSAFSTLNEVLILRKEEAFDDDCYLYGKLIAKKLRQFSELEREELMYDIDGLILKKRRANHQTLRLQNNPSTRISSSVTCSHKNSSHSTNPSSKHRPGQMSSSSQGEIITILADPNVDTISQPNC